MELILTSNMIEEEELWLFEVNKTELFFLSCSIMLFSNACNEITYLVHYIVNDLSDDNDIHRQCCKLYAQANMLARTFSMCSVFIIIIATFFFF